MAWNLETARFAALQGIRVLIEADQRALEEARPHLEEEQRDVLEAALDLLTRPAGDRYRQWSGF